MKNPRHIPLIVSPSPVPGGFYVKLPGEPLTEEQLRAHLTTIPDLAWTAINQLLAGRQLLAVGDAAGAHTLEQAFKAAGRIDETGQIVADLWRLSGRKLPGVAGPAR